MPRPANPTARRRILDASADLFYARGFAAVSTADIVSSAGCGKNVLYRHFPTKEALASAYLDEFAALREQQMDEAASSARDPREALVLLTQEVADQAVSPSFRGCSVRRYLLENGPGGVAADLAERWLMAWHQRIATLVEAFGGAPDLTEEIWLIHDGVYGSTAPESAGPAAVRVVTGLLNRASTGPSDSGVGHAGAAPHQ